MSVMLSMLAVAVLFVVFGFVARRGACGSDGACGACAGRCTRRAPPSRGAP